MLDKSKLHLEPRTDVEGHQIHRWVENVPRGLVSIHDLKKKVEPKSSKAIEEAITPKVEKLASSYDRYKSNDYKVLLHLSSDLYGKIYDIERDIRANMQIGAGQDKGSAFSRKASFDSLSDIMKRTERTRLQHGSDEKLKGLEDELRSVHRLYEMTKTKLQEIMLDVEAVPRKDVLGGAYSIVDVSRMEANPIPSQRMQSLFSQAWRSYSYVHDQNPSAGDIAEMTGLPHEYIRNMSEIVGSPLREELKPSQEIKPQDEIKRGKGMAYHDPESIDRLEKHLRPLHSSGLALAHPGRIPDRNELATHLSHVVQHARTMKPGERKDLHAKLQRHTQESQELAKRLDRYAGKAKRVDIGFNHVMDARNVRDQLKWATGKIRDMRGSMSHGEREEFGPEEVLNRLNANDGKTFEKLIADLGDNKRPDYKTEFSVKHGGNSARVYKVPEEYGGGYCVSFSHHKDQHTTDDLEQLKEYIAEGLAKKAEGE